MHGFFAKLALYDAARVLANPFAYHEHGARQVQAKLDTAAASRLCAPKPGSALAAAVAKVKVNKALAARVQRKQERARARARRAPCRAPRRPC
jgi:ribosome biogenesis protein ENP2